MSQNTVIVGAVALGPKAACRYKRLKPEAGVIMLDQGDIISYGGCGIPYFISGDVSDPEQLQSTSFHMVRDKKFFKDTKDIHVMTNTRALRIDRDKKVVHVRNVMNGMKEGISYDKLVIATGSRPKFLPIPGSNLEGVFTVSDIHKAVAIKKEISDGKVGKAVIIGAGAIGLEIAEALADLWGIETSVVEIENQILPGIINPNMAIMARNHMEENGVSFYLGEKVLSIEGDIRVKKLITEKRSIEADMVIMAVGVEPNSDLARDSGLETSPRGAIKVNSRMQTSDPDIYSGGDCVEVPNLITGKPGYWPLGSLANRQGRVIGTNLAGGDDVFDGAVGSFIIKLFEISVASAGFNMEASRKEGFDPVGAFVVQLDRSHFYPDKELLYMELTLDKGTGRVLGIHGLGGMDKGVMARVSAVASILKYGPVVHDISNLEFPYSPPFSSAMDILNALGNNAENILAGRNRVIDPDRFVAWWTQREKDDVFFLDCREWGNAGPFVEKYPEHWRHIPQGQLRSRMGEVPTDRKIVLICNTGVRSFEAQVTLDHHGISNTYNLEGGMAGVHKSGFSILNDE